MPEIIRAIVVDDEPDARDLLSARLADESDIELVAVCATGREAVDACREHKPHLLFLDIHMPGWDGFNVLQQLPNGDRPYVVFVTAYDQYAVRAFEYAAMDYLLKPFSRDRFKAALERARKTIAGAANTSNLPAPRELTRLWEQIKLSNDNQHGNSSEPTTERLVIKDAGGPRSIDVADIDKIEAADHYTMVRSKGTSFFYDESLAELESRLDPLVFLRVHKSMIVNLQAIEKITTGRFGSLELRLRNGATARVSRGRRSTFELAMLRISGDRP